jgi:hypothetical protein
MKAVLAVSGILFLAGQSFGKEPDAQQFERMRIEFASTPGFDSYAVMIKELGMARLAKQEWAAGHAQETIDRIKDLLAFYPLSILGNRMMAETCAELVKHTDDANRQKELHAMSEEHMKRYLLLLESITGNTECTSKEDHCKVITIEEENMVLFKMKLKKGSQALVFGDRPGMFYDAVDGTSPEGSVKTLFFDISQFYRGFQKN